MNRHSSQWKESTKASSFRKHENIEKRKETQKLKRFEKKYSYFFTLFYVHTKINLAKYNFIIIYNFICHVVKSIPLSNNGNTNIEKRKETEKLRGEIGKFEKKNILHALLHLHTKLISQNTTLIYNFIYYHMVYKSPYQASEKHPPFEYRKEKNYWKRNIPASSPSSTFTRKLISQNTTPI